MLALATQPLLLAFGLLSVSLPSVQHEIRLHEGFSSGGILEVRVNNQRVRLLLDTGARDIVLSARAAARCGLTSRNSAMLTSMTGHSVRAGQTSTSIEIDGLQLGEVPIRILAESPVQNADGLIGTQVFRDFVVEIDSQHRRLRLLAPDAGASAEAIPLREVGHMLFVRLDSGGYALVDTGSSYSIIDQSRLNTTGDVRWTQVRGATAVALQARYVGMPARFDLGHGNVLWDREPVSIDLTALSRKHGLAVEAVIGYPALSGRVVQLDYVNRTLRIVVPDSSFLAPERRTRVRTRDRADSAKDFALPRR